MIEFGFGVAATLGAELLLAHFFLWRDRVAVEKKIEAAVVGAKVLANVAPSFIKRVETVAAKTLTTLEGDVAGLLHPLTPTPVPPLSIGSSTGAAKA